MPNRSSRSLPIASVAIATLAVGLAAIGRGEPPRTASRRQDAKADGAKPTKGWSTAESCNICHREDAKAAQKVTDFVKLGEYDFWKKNDKHHEGFASLQGERGKEMQRRLGWDVSTDVRCLSCHAPAATSGVKDQDAIAEGVSCVACHGAYTEWVAAHGALGNKAKQEEWIATPAADKRDRYGMTDLRDPAVRAKTCASCHVGDLDQGRVITHEMYAAGHPPLPGLEVATFSEAEPPHWWAMKDVPYLDLSDRALGKRFGAPNILAQKPRIEALRKNYRVDEFPTQEAKLVAIGSVVTLRESLNLFAATAPAGRSGTADFARFDCASCHHELTVSADSFRQARGFVGDPGRPPWAEWPTALVSIAVAAGEPDQGKRDERLQQFEKNLGRFRQAVAKTPFGGDNVEAVEAASRSRHGPTGWPVSSTLASSPATTRSASSSRSRPSRRATTPRPASSPGRSEASTTSSPTSRRATRRSPRRSTSSSNR